MSHVRTILFSIKCDFFSRCTNLLSGAVFGGEFYEEQLAMIKMIVEKVTRYLLLPGLDIDININGKVGSLLDCC